MDGSIRGFMASISNDPGVAAFIVVTGALCIGLFVSISVWMWLEWRERKDD